MTTVSEEHDRAVHRLDAALSEQDRLSERYEAAVGTSAEMPADVERQAATAQVAACDAWLKWVDDDGYRGLNAGPFALRSQLEEPPTSRR